jgi:uncharacterized protein YjbJ (UPF0337 family)
MARDIFQDSWEQLKERITKQWGKLTEEDLMLIGGDRQMLINKLRLHYGFTTEEATTELYLFLKPE